MQNKQIKCIEYALYAIIYSLISKTTQTFNKYVRVQKIMKLLDMLRKLINSQPIRIVVVVVSIYFVYVNVLLNASDILQGAFWAVLVSYLTYLVTKAHDLHIARYNSMVFLHQELNLCLNDLCDIIFHVDEVLNSKVPLALYPINITLTEEHIKRLGREDIRRSLYLFYIGIKRINKDVNSTFDNYKENFNTFKATSYPSPESGKEAFDSFYSPYCMHLQELKKYTETIIDEAKICIVQLRFFQRIDKPIFSSSIFERYYSKYDYKKWLERDKEKLERELIEDMKKTP